METRKQRRDTLEATVQQILATLQRSVDEGIRTASNAAAAGGTYNSGSTIRTFVGLIVDASTKARGELIDAYIVAGERKGEAITEKIHGHLNERLHGYLNTHIPRPPGTKGRIADSILLGSLAPDIKRVTDDLPNLVQIALSKYHRARPTFTSAAIDRLKDQPAIGVGVIAFTVIAAVVAVVAHFWH